MVASVGFESGSIGHFRVPSHSQTEAKCKTFVVKMLYHIHEEKKNEFHIHGFALGLALN